MTNNLVLLFLAKVPYLIAMIAILNLKNINHDDLLNIQGLFKEYHPCMLQLIFIFLIIFSFDGVDFIFIINLNKQIVSFRGIIARYFC